MAAKSTANRGAKKSYAYGEKKQLRITKDVVVISDTEKTRSIEIPFQRWASLMRYVADIEESAYRFYTDGFVQYKQHFGGGWFASVTSGFPCVDIRKFYLPPFGIEPKPTKSGLTVRFPEWKGFVTAARNLNDDNPQLAQFQPCDIHPNQEEAMICGECNPFGDSLFASNLL
jgi:hypothetical protein